MEKSTEKTLTDSLIYALVVLNFKNGVRKRYYDGIQPKQRGGHEDGKEIRI
jgi:hypothetical protein